MATVRITPEAANGKSENSPLGHYMHVTWVSRPSDAELFGEIDNTPVL